VEVKIPFKKQFETVMIERLKTSTTRHSKQGEIGDTFTAFGCIFTISNVVETTLGEVATNWHEGEGYSSPGDFITDWNNIFTYRPYSADTLVYWHEFTFSGIVEKSTSEYRRTAKSKRCFHRVMSGLTRGGKLRFLTLTSSNSAPADIQRSWRALQMRMVRRGLLKGYIKVPEQSEDGRKHLHVLFRGSYVEQALIKAWWSQIHNSDIVDIRLVKTYGNNKAIASYMAKYMSKELAGRYSWSWGWVWRGFCKDWTLYKKYWWTCVYAEGKNTFGNCIVGWNMWLKGAWEPDRFGMQVAIEQRKMAYGK